MHLIKMYIMIADKQQGGKNGIKKAFWNKIVGQYPKTSMGAVSENKLSKCPPINYIAKCLMKELLCFTVVI